MEKRSNSRLALIHSKIRGAYVNLSDNNHDKDHYVKATYIKDGEPQELSIFALTEDSFEKIEHDVVFVATDHPI